MPTISFVSTKGGSGKTTSCIVLGTELSRWAKVMLIDTDPRKRLKKWYDRAPDLLENVDCVAETDKKAIQNLIRSAQETHDYVLVDTEGVAEARNAYAIGNSNLVIVPLRDRQQDSEDAIDTIEEIESIGMMQQNRKIPYKLLFTSTKVVAKAKLQRHLNESMRESYPAFEAELIERTAFDAIINAGGGLKDLGPEISGREEATTNAIALVEELIATFEEDVTLAPAEGSVAMESATAVLPNKQVVSA